MAITEPTIEQQAPYLLKLFEAEMARTLVKAAMEQVDAAYRQAMLDIRPGIEAAAREAVKGMEATLRSHYRDMEGKMVVAFVGKLADGTYRCDTPGVVGEHA